MSRKRTFRLEPFDLQEDAMINVKATIQAESVYLSYFIYLSSTNLQWPDKVEKPKFQDKLWYHTCLEFFYLTKQGYIEWNLSPKGHWACFHFEKYRSEPTMLKDQKPLSLKVQQHGSHYHLEAELPWKPKTPNTKIQIAAILERGGSLSYWSSEHPKDAPDFHLHKHYRSCKTEF